MKNLDFFMTLKNMHEVRKNKGLRGIRKSIKSRIRRTHHIFATLVVLMTLSVGEMWGDIAYSGGYIYFDNSLGINSTTLQICARQNSWTGVSSLTNISNTKLYYVADPQGSGWSGILGWVVISANPAKSNSDFDNWSDQTWCSDWNTYGFNSGSTYLIVPSSTSKSQSVTTTYYSGGYSALNADQTIKSYVSTDNGSTYSNANSKATISITSYKMTGNGAVTKQTGSITTSAKTATVSAARTATTTLSVGTVTSGYVFVGWYDSSDNLLSSNTSYTYYPTAATEIRARFKNETAHNVTHTEYCTSTSTQLSTETVSVGEVTYSEFSAPVKTGYTFANWTVGNGLTIKSGDSNTSNPIHVITKSSGSYTLRANYTEDLSSDWVVRGDSKFGSTWSANTNAMTKKTGHSAESVVYYTASIDAAAGANDNTAFNFKIYNTTTSKWYGLAGDGDYWYYRSTGELTMLENNQNIQLRADMAGSYEIKVDYSTPASPKVTVTFPSEPHYTVTVNAGTGGRITTPASPATTVEGYITTPTTITAVADNGYYFTGWTKTSGTVSFADASSATTTITASAVSTIQANFAPIWYIKAEWNSWGLTDPLTTFSSATAGYADIDINVANTIKNFKLYNKQTDTWYHSSANITPETPNYVTTFTSGNGADCAMRIYLSGTYRFAINASSATPTITVTYPTDAYQLQIYSADPTDATNTGYFDLSYLNTNNYRVQRDLQANTTYSFKIVSSTAYYGDGTAFIHTNHKVISSNTGDMTLTTKSAGQFTITWNNSTNDLSVNYPPSISVTSSAESVYTGTSITLTGWAENIGSGNHTIKYEFFKGTTLNDANRIYQTDNIAYTYASGGTHNQTYTFTQNFAGDATSQIYTVRFTCDGTSYTNTVTVYRKWDIYVHDVASWGGMYNYMWDNGEYAAWPGVTCPVYNGSTTGWYQVTIDAKYPKFQLNCYNCTNTMRTFGGNDAYTPNHATFPTGSYWYTKFDNTGGDGHDYYTLESITLTDPEVEITSATALSCTQLQLVGSVTDCGNDGSTAAEMKEVGFYVGATKYTATCKDGITFTVNVSGLTANTAYTVKAFATNIHGTAETATQSATTRASSTYTIRVQVDRGATAPYIYAYTDATDCGGAVEQNAAFPGVQLVTKAVSGSVKDWWTYSMPTTYNYFRLSAGNSSTQSRAFAAPQEEKCYWFISSGANENARADQMECPSFEPQLMINTPAAPTTYTYYDMSTSPTISVTRSLEAKSTYKFKIVYGAEWYGKASTTLTRASNSATGVDAASGDNREIQLTTDAAGDYTFTFTAPGTIAVTYPEASPITFGVGTVPGGGAVTVSPAFTSGDYINRAQAITFTQGSVVDGYAWSGWYDNAAGTGDVLGTGDTYTSAANSRTNETAYAFYACYNKLTYTITYELNGGENPVSPAPVTSYTVTDAVTLPTPTKSGYRFLGWYDNEGFTGSPIASFAAGTFGNKTYWAKWIQLVTYDVYFYNKDKWATPKAYLWIEGSEPLVRNAAWPGEAMSAHSGPVYKYQFESADGFDRIQFNAAANSSDVSAAKTANLTLPGYNQAFYNPEGEGAWTHYIMVAAFPTETIAAVLGEKVTVEPVVAWASGINFSDLTITATRTSGSEDIQVVPAGTKLQIMATAAGTANYTITYSYGGTTITKTMVVVIRDGVTIQAKIAKSDTNHWIDKTKVKMHYWGSGIGNSNLEMKWLKADGTYNYYQACVPKGSNDKANFLFYYDYMKDEGSTKWHQTDNVENVTTNGCYTISYTADGSHSSVSRDGDICVEIWQLQIIMGSGDVYTSNVVSGSDEVVSFFAPGNIAGDPSYRKGTVTLERNGNTAATLTTPESPNVFSESGVYTAKINTSNNTLTNVALYTGDYYIRTDPSAGGWNNYKEQASNKMIKFTRNTNFPNESFSYYWVDNVAKGNSGTVNIKATVANDYNPVLCEFSADDNIAREEHGVNLRFGYEPTTNDLVRGILRGASFDNFLNIVCREGSQIYQDIECTTLLNEEEYSSSVANSQFQDKSNWVYDITVYAKIDDDHQVANVVLKSAYNGVHYLLGMEKDNYGRETSTPIEFRVIKTGTTNGIYGLRTVYDFKTNRLFAAWAPVDRVIDGVLTVDADVMFLRHENGDAAQISFKTDGGEETDKITGLKQAIFALELDNENSANKERHYFISLPYDCRVGDIFGIGGFMNYWGIQRYNGALRAQKGWFQDTPTFWEWLDENDVMNAGEGYLLSVDKSALADDDVWKTGIIYQTLDTIKSGGVPIKTADGLSDSVAWVTHTDGSLLTMYFPSSSTGFEIQPASGAALTISYPDQPCSITRNDRNIKDSNWKCIGTPGYNNIKVSSYTSSATNAYESAAPNFLYEFNEQTTSARWAAGTYTVRDGSDWTYHSFNSYMVQFAGTINWAQYSQNKPNSVVARRAPEAETKLTKAEINLLNAEDESLDRTFVWLQDNATIGFDQNFDLNKIVEENANQIYSLAENDVPFAANVLPLETDTVALVVNIAKNGEYTFSLNSDKHQGMAPVLYDMFESTETNLLDAPYTLELAKGKYEGRFYLLFHPVKPIVTSFETTEDGGQNVLSDEAIYDVLGRKVNTIYPGHLYIVNGEKRVCY